MARPKASVRRTSGHQTRPQQKQNTLSFAAQSGKITKATAAASSSLAKAAESKANKLLLESDVESSAAQSPAAAVVDVHPPEEEKPAVRAAKKEVPIRQQQQQKLRQEEEEEEEEEARPVAKVEAVLRSEDEEAAVKVSDAQVKRYWRAKEEARMTPRVHQQKLSLHDKILREFDLCSQYGPCVGIARTRRWKRAHGLGLHPPIEVLKVLLDEDERTETKVQRAYIDELLSSKNID